jgi:Ca-activated chloride channel family protein
MKAGKYRDAVRAYELAVDGAPEWTEAADNLALANYTVEYIEQAREESSTGDQPDLSADAVEFDNEENRGRDTEISRDSMLGQDSAEKWMRAVNTDTSDFLRSRFLLEASREAGQ